MNTDDHAILIGISHYPEFGEGGQPADLRGPANDVDAIKAWLLDPKGGGFPDDSRIHVIKSAPAVSASDATPTTDRIVAAIVGELDAIAQANRQAGRGLRIGQRLYLFLTGHGYSPERQRGCLFTPNATARLALSVDATGCLKWLQDSGYFREFVLWMDCCMNRFTSLPSQSPPPVQQVNAAEPPRASFIAFAAQRPLKAVELPINEDAGTVHGAFTWTLLEGLRGAAADSNGRVTGRSLADWIRNAQEARMAPPDLENVDVAKEPEVIQEDAGLIFARGVSKPRYTVRVSFPAKAAPGPARLWSGSPPRVVQEVTVGPEPETMTLEAGLYLIDVPRAGLRKGFVVVGPMGVSIEEEGPPVREAQHGSLFQLEIDPADPTAEIFVIDGRFSLVDSSPARLSTPLPFGLFKIKTRIGRTRTQRVILLDDERPPLERAVIIQPAAVVPPILGTATSHESHAYGREEAVRKANALAVAPDRAAIMVVARAFSGKDAPVPDTRPWEGVSIVDAQGEPVLELAEKSTLKIDGDPYGYSVKAVEPGSYFLRQRLDDGTNIEQSLIACEGWRLEVYVLRRVLPEETALAPRPRVAVTMHRLGEGPGSDEEERLIDIARQALADERRILSAELETLLLQKFENPMAGIIGGHLLLVERDRDPGRDLSLLDAVVRRLQALVGRGHPDVAALALRCADARLRRIGALLGPPMLQRSWKLLAQAAQKRRSLIPMAMWERVVAQSTLPPFLVWVTDDAIKEAAHEGLDRAIFSARSAPQPVKRLERARAAQLSVPPCGFEALQVRSSRRAAPEAAE